MADDEKPDSYATEQVGSEAFGEGPDGKPTGSAAVGGEDEEHPLRGALLFGNDPAGEGRGSEAVGEATQGLPLRGALLFGNDPEGEGRGAEAIGEPTKSVPLRGALLFGNDPDGWGRGAEAFGEADKDYPFRGALAFGAPDKLPRRLHKDAIGYDFGGVLLTADDVGIAGIRRDSRDRVRVRVLAALGRYLGIESDRVRHGLGEEAIPWGKLRREREMDRSLADQLRQAWKRAPGGVLGIGQARDLLEHSDRLHSFSLSCQWDELPWKVEVRTGGRPKDGEAVAFAYSLRHRGHAYFVFRDLKGIPVAYADCLRPHEGEQVAKMRRGDGKLVATFHLDNPPQGEIPTEVTRRFRGRVKDHRGRRLFDIEEKRIDSKSFLAELRLPDTEEEVGRVRDTLAAGKVEAAIELDLRMPKIVAWATGVMLADLARVRRAGWPEPPPVAERRVPRGRCLMAWVRGLLPEIEVYDKNLPT